MDFGLTLTTHGVMTRDEAGDAQLLRLDVEDMHPIEDSIRAEALGFHSVWLSDHVVTERVSIGEHTANSSGKRAYPDRPNLLDVPTTMAAIAARTTTLRFAPSVHIAPYRHPLSTAHEMATIDVLSGGRLIMAVGVGWELGEFEAMSASFEHRGSVTEECIEIMKLAWTEPWISYAGKHFQFGDVSMDPKPVQRPHPPIWYGGMTKAAARRAAKHCTGLYPMFLDAHGRPENMDHLREEVKREGERLGRDLSGFRLGGFCTIRLCDDSEIASRFGGKRPMLTGSAEQVLSDLQEYADYGYSHITVHLDTPSGRISEWEENVERFAAEVLSVAHQLEAGEGF
jgi:probable F420-dependent oxidoreductase